MTAPAPGIITRQRTLLLALVVAFLLFVQVASARESSFELKVAAGAGKFSGGMRFFNEKATTAIFLESLERFLQSGNESFISADDVKEDENPSLTRHGSLNHGWILVSGVYHGNGFEGMELVFLVNWQKRVVQILYAEESGSAILARFLPDPSGSRVFVGRDWYYSDCCFSCFEIGVDGAVRNERFENASRLAHILVRRVVKTDSAGEVELFSNEKNGRFRFLVHERDLDTPVVCEVEFDEVAGLLLLKAGSAELTKVNFVIESGHAKF